MQSRFHWSGRGLHTVRVIGEQVDVFGDPVNDAVRDQGVAAAERESVAARDAERDDGYLAVEGR